jgi:phosphoglycolate phosphatase-like HAD superfamily hydrolase
VLEAGYLLGWVTGNLEAAAHIKLHRARLNRFFSFGGYGSGSRDRTEVTRIAVRRGSMVYGEELSVDPCLVVGDTTHDVEAAQGAGVACMIHGPGRSQRSCGRIALSKCPAFATTHVCTKRPTALVRECG